MNANKRELVNYHVYTLEEIFTNLEVTENILFRIERYSKGAVVRDDLLTREEFLRIVDAGKSEWTYHGRPDGIDTFFMFKSWRAPLLFNFVPRKEPVEGCDFWAIPKGITFTE